VTIGICGNAMSDFLLQINSLKLNSNQWNLGHAVLAEMLLHCKPVRYEMRLGLDINSMINIDKDVRW
jgi:hypothetical protein